VCGCGCRHTLFLGGIVSVLFGVILAVFPGSGALAIVWLIGVYAIVAGIVQLTLAFRLHRGHDRARHRAQGTAA